VRSLNKARDIREQLEGLCDRVEIEIVSLPNDIDQICKTSDQAEQDAEKKSIENRDPKVRGSEDIIDYTSNQQNPNINVSTDTSVDDLS
jgi:hypothetical protein